MKIGEIDLLNTDCVEYMKGLPDKALDLAIVDPPFGIGPTWSKSTEDQFFKRGRKNTYQNNEIPSKEYFQNLFRISKDQIIWGANYYTDFLPPKNSWIVWDKNRDADATFMSEGELAWTSFNKVLRIKTFQWDGAKKCESVERIHPHQKPIALYKWLLKNYAKEGDKIIDTHLGSGSIAIACHDYKFSLVGCELDKDYYEAACKRFKNHIAQTSLF